MKSSATVRLSSHSAVIALTVVVLIGAVFAAPGAVA